MHPAGGPSGRQRVSRRYRNRRIGEFLKELDLTEGRSTGIPKILKVMAANGSPAPLFETDDDRVSFVIRLPSHPLARGASRPPKKLPGKLPGKLSAYYASWMVRCPASRFRRRWR
ncbi:ATP-binding protein [Candidatus Accumulibacter phosphatis]|uniref:ATP-binding protein n=1 Tax=Candidatus Accumulibacter phosphatis TaxID=327160 RepID=UPI0039B994DF